MASANRRQSSAKAGGALVSLVGAAAIVVIAFHVVQAATGVNPGVVLDTVDRGAATIRHAIGVDPNDLIYARSALPRLTVTGPGSLTGYVRGPAQWGPTWADVDHNGCRTRDDILRRDLTQTVLTGRCAVVSGVLADPYTGKTIRYSRTHATAVQIDHVVPLAEAWRSGARAWTTARREQLANDPAELLAVDGPANESKGDSGPDEWQPAAAFRCAYAAKYVLVKVRYRLTVTAPEKRALETTLTACR